MDSTVASGLISAGVVLLAVGATALVTAWQQQKRRLEEAVWKLLERTSRLTPGPSGVLSAKEVTDYFDGFLASAVPVQQAARWPLRNARAIRREVEDILIRHAVAIGRWQFQGAEMPNLRDVVEGRLAILALAPPWARDFDARLDAALQAAGLPTVADAVAKEAAPPS